MWLLVFQHPPSPGSGMGTELSNSRVTLSDLSEATNVADVDDTREMILQTSRTINLSMTEDGDSGS